MYHLSLVSFSSRFLDFPSSLYKSLLFHCCLPLLFCSIFQIYTKLHPPPPSLSLHTFYVRLTTTVRHTWLYKAALVNCRSYISASKVNKTTRGRGQVRAVRMRDNDGVEHRLCRINVLYIEGGKDERGINKSWNMLLAAPPRPVPPCINLLSLARVTPMHTHTKSSDAPFRFSAAIFPCKLHPGHVLEYVRGGARL